MLSSRNDGLNINVLGVRSEPLLHNTEMVRIERDVGKLNFPELSVVMVRGKAADRVVIFHGRIRNTAPRDLYGTVTDVELPTAR